MEQSVATRRPISTIDINKTIKIPMRDYESRTDDIITNIGAIDVTNDRPIYFEDKFDISNLNIFFPNSELGKDKFVLTQTPGQTGWLTINNRLIYYKDPYEKEEQAVEMENRYLTSGLIIFNMATTSNSGTEYEGSNNDRRYYNFNGPILSGVALIFPNTEVIYYDGITEIAKYKTENNFVIHMGLETNASGVGVRVFDCEPKGAIPKCPPPPVCPPPPPERLCAICPPEPKGYNINKYTLWIIAGIILLFFLVLLGIIIYVTR